MNYAILKKISELKQSGDHSSIKLAELMSQSELLKYLDHSAKVGFGGLMFVGIAYHKQTKSIDAYWNIEGGGWNDLSRLFRKQIGILPKEVSVFIAEKIAFKTNPFEPDTGCVTSRVEISLRFNV